jgi:carbamoyl-phosphate synthase large subunit
MDLKILWTISGSMGTASDISMLKDAKGFNIEVVTADREGGDSIGSYVTGKKYVIPPGEDKTYIDRVADICREEGITTIIPQYGDELVPLSRNRELFEGMGVKVLVSEDADKLEKANNKQLLYEFFGNKWFIPKYSRASQMKELQEALYILGYPQLPVCIKPVQSEGGRGFRVITDEKVHSFGEASLNHINWQALRKQLEYCVSFPELLVMEYLPGREYSVDCVCKDGRTLICIPRQRIKTAMGVSVVSCLEKNESIITVAKEIISDLRLSYNINIQFKYSSDGKPMLIEVNPRVSGSLVANCGGGVNMLEASLNMAYGLKISDINIEWGTKMIRYWEQTFIKE